MMTEAMFSGFEHTTVGILHLVFGIVGGLLNLFLVLTLIREKSFFKSGRTWLHISLGLANLGVVGAFPFSSSSSFSGRWLYGSKMCQVYGFAAMFSGIASIGNTYAICVERYVVSKKAESGGKISSLFYGMITGLVWINAFFWAIMPVLGWSSYDTDPSGTACSLKWQNYDAGYPSYMVMLSSVSFSIPMITAAFCLLSSSSRGKEKQQQPKTHFTEANLRSICYFFLALHVIGWGPYCFVCIWALFADTTNVSLLASIIPSLAAKGVVLLYPLAYCMTNKRFKDAIMSMFRATVTIFKVGGLIVMYEICSKIHISEKSDDAFFGRDIGSGIKNFQHISSN